MLQSLEERGSGDELGHHQIDGSPIQAQRKQGGVLLGILLFLVVALGVAVLYLLFTQSPQSSPAAVNSAPVTETTVQTKKPGQGEVNHAIKIADPAPQKRIVVKPTLAKVAEPKLVESVADIEPRAVTKALVEPFQGMEADERVVEEKRAGAVKEPTEPGIKRLEPSILIGSKDRQPVRIFGYGLDQIEGVRLCWPGNCTTLRGSRLVNRTPSVLQINIRTGIQKEKWTIQLLSTDYGLSEKSTLQIVPPGTSLPVEVEVFQGESPVNEKQPPELNSGLSPLSNEPPINESVAVAPEGGVSVPIEEDSSMNSNELQREAAPLTLRDQADELYIQGTSAMKNGDINKASRYWRQALLLYPLHHNSREQVAAVLLAENRTSEAVDTLNRGLYLEPSHHAFTLILARIELDRGNLEAAIEATESAIGRSSEASPASAELYAFSATLYQRKQEYKISVERYQKALEMSSNNGLWWLGLGISLDQINESSTALTAFKRASESPNLQQRSLEYVRSRIISLEEQIQQTDREFAPAE